MTKQESGTPNFRLDEKKIDAALKKAAKADAAKVREVLAKAREMKGLSSDEAAVLTGIDTPELLEELFGAARFVKENIYGRRLVIFAPLYISNLCANDCLYCAFRVKNKEIKRRALNQDEIALEVKALIETGQKRVLLVAGESYPKQGFQYVLDSIKTVYDTKSGAHGEIRRVNVNIAPLKVDEFRLLHEAAIGTYQLFQETYHPATYKQMHQAGPKSDYDWRVTAMDRAMQSGIEDVGIGVLFGLADWRYEILALLQHAEHLDATYKCGPHTISVPRLEPAAGSQVAEQPPQPVSDLDFRKIVAILRLAVPYTGIIMSTRETPNLRRETFAIGVSQISAGSRTNPGGYAEGERPDGQFSLGDHRSLDEVIKDIAEMGYIPSFCTACYRLGRTGADFMDYAKPGEIKTYCDPNALSTFQEYLRDYGSDETKKAGEKLIQQTLAKMDEKSRTASQWLIEKVRAGETDCFY